MISTMMNPPPPVQVASYLRVASVAIAAYEYVHLSAYGLSLGQTPFYSYLNTLPVSFEMYFSRRKTLGSHSIIIQRATHHQLTHHSTLACPLCYMLYCGECAKVSDCLLEVLSTIAEPRVISICVLTFSSVGYFHYSFTAQICRHFYALAPTFKGKRCL
jgi:hypothetical protein